MDLGRGSTMNIAILTFPGTNCERDLYNVITNTLKQQATYVRHDISDPNALNSFDIIMLPGGSSYGDMVRPGKLASQAPIMTALHNANKNGKCILGICNGFQILTEAGILPGFLVKNPTGKFICKTVPIIVETNKTSFTHKYKQGQRIRYPIAHGTGRYQCSDAALKDMQENNQIVFTYATNINDSLANIAGVTNKAGNVLGLMPHPERAMDMLLGCDDGLNLFHSMLGCV